MIGSVEARFWHFVAVEDGCWLWMGHRLPKGGYGVLGVGEKNKRAHRVSWELHNGPIPDGLWVLHHCDNPPCVRPDHLFLGTHLDNMRDAKQKGRLVLPPHHCGEETPNATLTTEQVRKIRRLKADGVSRRQAAAQLNLSEWAVKHVFAGSTWRHV